MFSIDMYGINDGIQQILDRVYLRVLSFKLAMILLILVGLNYFTSGLFHFNFIESLLTNTTLLSIFYVIIGISAILIMFDRDTYLPFLGPMVAPCSILKDITPSDATLSVKVIVTPNTKVLYWAAEPSTVALENITNWKEAYLGYENAGVTTSDENGVAILQVREPQPYRVVFKGVLEPHIHYRVCGKDGWIGRINTVKVTNKKVEGFLPKVTRDIYDKKNKLDTSDYSASIY